MLLAVLAAGLFDVSPALGADSIYWGNYNVANRISFVALDGSDGGDLAITGGTMNLPHGIAFDPAAGRIYWANAGGNKISYAGLPGLQGADLVTTPATVSIPAGVAVDPTAGKVYWANFNHANAISFANLDGSGGGNLNTTGATPPSGPQGVVVDPGAGRIYWASSTGNKISWANLNGSGGADLATTGATVASPTGVALDLGAGKIYWANATSGKISWANLDGSGGGGDLTTTGATVNGPKGVALDPNAGKIYWANYGAGKISYANLDGSGGGDLTTLSATVSTPLFPVLLKRPSGTSAPAITGGTTVGSVLSCSQGSWASDIVPSFLYRAPQSFAYQWARNGVDIGGATSASHMASAPGSYTCRVTASNFAGTAQQSSLARTVLATLTATKAGSGSGMVVSSPAGIGCGATCSAGFGDGTSVTLTATASPGSSFAGWSGDCAGTGNCTVTMSADHAAAATFESDKTLTVGQAGSGFGSITSDVGGIACGSTCSHAYRHGTSVTLTATASAGSVFAGWSGACSGTGPCTVTMSSDRAVVATFEGERTLTVGKAGGGSGSISSIPPGIACGLACSHAYTFGTSVTLTATASAGSVFAGWSGACSGTGLCTVAMTANRSATATFNPLCVVPNVKGKTLVAAKSAIKKAHCSVGTVKKAFSSRVRTGRVISQKPAPGATRPQGAKVNLVVSRGKRT